MIYLKANSEATFMTALKAAGWVWDTKYRVEYNEATQEETITEEVIMEAGEEYYNTTHSLDIIGQIYLPTGNNITVDATVDDLEYTYAEMAPIDGWHANLLLHGEKLPDALSEFVIEAPTTPSRTFA
jgi:hypothetical protein